MDLSNENVIHIKKGDFEYLQFKKLLEYENILVHAYSLGTDMNFRTYRPSGELTKEEKKISRESYNKLCKSLNLEYNNFVKATQAHTDCVKIVDHKINKNAPDFNVKEYENSDGLITNKKNFVLGTQNADCILMLFFDPVKKVIASVHSGWKGTLQRISVKAAEKMKEEFASNPQDIICCMCPSIRKCHFEVDEEVKNLFWEEFKDLEQINQIIEKNSNKEKWNIDTILINQIILEQIGLKKENIIDSKICSVCNSNIVHSYRVEKEDYGLETAIITLK